MATYVFTSDNALNDRCIQRCRLVMVDQAGWAKVQVGKHSRFVPPHSWANTADAARDKLKDQVNTRLSALVDEARALKCMAESLDDLQVVDATTTTPDAGPALGLEALL